MSRARGWCQGLAVAGNLGTLATLVLWYGWGAPSAHFPAALVLLLLGAPLLLPLRGLLHGRPYTHAWSSLLATVYLGHGLVELYASPGARPWAAAEVVLVSAWIVGAIGYVWLGRAAVEQKE